MQCFVFLGSMPVHLGVNVREIIHKKRIAIILRYKKFHLSGFLHLKSQFFCDFIMMGYNNLHDKCGRHSFLLAKITNPQPMQQICQRMASMSMSEGYLTYCCLILLSSAPSNTQQVHITRCRWQNLQGQALRLM